MYYHLQLIEQRDPLLPIHELILMTVQVLLSISKHTKKKKNYHLHQKEPRQQQKSLLIQEIDNLVKERSE